MRQALAHTLNQIADWLLLPSPAWGRGLGGEGDAPGDRMSIDDGRGIRSGTHRRAGRPPHPNPLPQSGEREQKAVASSTSDSATQFLDAYKKHRQPTSTDLLAELKNTAWTCASINASVCASNAPKVYVRTTDTDPRPKCRTKPLAWDHPLVLKARTQDPVTRIDEVLDHPLVTLLKNVNEVHNSFDLFELTQFYMELFGRAYWYIEKDGFGGLPSSIWIIPSHNIRPVRKPGSSKIVDYYEYRIGSDVQRYDPSEIICFRLPDPRDPYREGFSPLKACFEQVALSSQYAAMKRAIYDNTGIPSVFVSPGEMVNEDERARLETEWNQKFRKGGQGRVLVAESAMKVDILSHSMGDLAALAEAKATKEDIANAFHVPMPYLTTNTNLANMEAAEIFHLRLAIMPRLRRRDEKLNEQLVPLYDTSGRLFIASEDPTPTNKKHVLQQQEQDIRLNIRTINEVRAERGYPPVPWGNQPLLNPSPMAPGSGIDHNSNGQVNDKQVAKLDAQAEPSDATGSAQ